MGQEEKQPEWNERLKGSSSKSYIEAYAGDNGTSHVHTHDDLV